MFRRCVAVAIVLALLGILSIPSPVAAWEFRLDAYTHVYSYVYLTQKGNRGFFGPNNVDRGTTGDFANANFWPGLTPVTGSDAATGFNIFAMYPVVQVNPAISVRGDMWVGPYFTDTAPTSPNPLVQPGILPGGAAANGTQVATILFGDLWAELNLPMGRLYYGKKPFGQGCGLQYMGSNRSWDMWQLGRSEEYLELEAPYGPLTINLGIYPWRIGGGAYNNLFLTQFYDRNAARIIDVYGSVRYLAANLDTGIGTIWSTFHEGPESQTLAAGRVSFVPRDTYINEGWAYLKYNNGRFFFNTEADWFYRTVRNQRSQDGTFGGTAPIPFAGGGSLFAPTYIESWRYMAELGCMYGPAKFSFLYAYLPGPDRRHGRLIDKQPFVQQASQTAAGVFFPYATMLNLLYRSGVNSAFDLSDASVLAARFDYGLASNLQIFATGLYARRASKSGYGWGYIKPSLASGVLIAQTGTFAAPAPSIPDDYIGTEASLGLRWMMLEDWLVDFTVGYFWPGQWWKFACIDKSVPGWNAQVAGATAFPFGTNPDRVIDEVGMIRLDFHIGL